ncbi:Protein of unknown function (DUF2975) [Frankia sp. EI5c]|nr:Protein of unknown function (DUF2975) [Frankia sp. EI5c]
MSRSSRSCRFSFRRRLNRSGPRARCVTAPGQRDDPGVTVIMGGVGLAVLGVALIVLVLRMLLAQAVARDVEASQLQAELDEVI